MMKNGLLYFEGRRDTQIKIRGHRMDITCVEKNVNELEYVLKSAILVHHNAQPDQALVTFVVLKPNVQKIAMAVEKDLQSRLPSYMIPQIIIIEEFPHLPSGKVDRQSLLKMYEENAIGEQDNMPVKMDLSNIPKEKLNTARQVFAIIGQSLGTELRSKVTAKSNFFELGGNSLNSVFTVVKLRDNGFQIGLTDFLQARTVADILNRIVLSKKPQALDGNLRIVADMKLIAEPLDKMEKDEAMMLLATCFYHKADLDCFLNDLKIEHYLEAFESIWDDAVKNGLSFMAMTSDGDLLGVSLNFDVEDEPEPQIESCNPLGVVFEFLEFVEMPVL